jgi:hypothetical protein
VGVQASRKSDWSALPHPEYLGTLKQRDGRDLGDGSVLTQFHRESMKPELKLQRAA